VKTIPIAKHRDEEPQVVMSLGADKIGELQDGDRLEGTADVEVSVSLEPNPGHPGANKCVDGTYGYNPTVRAWLVLGPSELSSGDGSTVRVSGAKSLRCPQRLLHRNHHCVLVVDDGRLKIDDAQALPCNPNDCHLTRRQRAQPRGQGRAPVVDRGGRGRRRTGGGRQGNGQRGAVPAGAAEEGEPGRGRSLAVPAADRGQYRRARQEERCSTRPRFAIPGRASR
jgi:hypothetical protein